MLFEERILNNLLQDIGRRLAKKPFTWMSWWRVKRWITVFLIIPPLSEEYPLWKRGEASLRSLRLFGLEPQVLQAEIQAYWKRPFWRRWWLSLFTAIHHKRKVYAYYQCCLSFSRIKKQHAHTDSIVKGGGIERAILLELVAWFDRDIKHGEKLLEQHVGDLNWLPSRFTSILDQYEQKIEQKLLRYMEKKLKKLPIIRIKNSIQSQIKKEYQELGKFRRDYLLSGLFPLEQGSTYNDEASASGVANEATEHRVLSDSHELVCLDAVVATRNRLRMYPAGEADLSDMDSVGKWVKLKQHVIASLLEEGRPEAYIEIKVLLEQSLNSIKILIESQIECYQQLIKKAKQSNVECEVAIERSEDLQPRLIRFFRSSALLFHPDKSDRNEELNRIQTELFKEFNQFSESSRETLIQGLQTLKKCIPKRATYLTIWEEMERNREETRAKVEKFMAKHEKFMEKIEQDRLQQAQKVKEWNAKITRMEEKIKRLNNLLTENITMHHTSEEVMSLQDPEKAETSTNFFGL
jgi:hypothetical protein